MKIGKIASILTGILKSDARIVVELEGDAGIGKTEIVYEAAAEAGYEVINLKIAQMEPGDLIGIPRIIDGKTVWAKPSWFPEDNNKKYLIFLDESKRGQLDVKNAILQLLAEYRLHTHILPKSTRIVLANNPANDNYQVEEEGKAMVNRYCKIHTEIDPEAFYVWAKNHDVDEKVLNFLMVQPDLLLSVPQKAEPYPSPRSWFYASELFRAGALAHKSADEYELVAGLVGTTAAAAYIRYVQDNYKKFVTAKEIFSNFEKVRAQMKEQRNDTMTATISDLIAAISMKDEKQTFKARYKILTKVITSVLTEEFQVMLISKLNNTQRSRLVEADSSIGDRIAKITAAAK